MAETRLTQQVKEALSKGDISYLDHETGYLKSITAKCPEGHPSTVSRTEKEDGAIYRVVFHCPICGSFFEVDVNRMYLV